MSQAEEISDGKVIINNISQGLDGYVIVQEVGVPGPRGYPGSGGTNVDFSSPEDFGAKADGISDDTIPFVLSILSGKKVKLNSKTYYIPQIHLYDLPEVLDIQGNGKERSFLKGAMSWPVNSPNLSQNCFNIKITKTIILKGISFKNFGITLRVPNTSASLSFDIDKIFIDECEFANSYMVFSTLRNTFYNVSIKEIQFTRNHVHDCQTGFWAFAKIKTANVNSNLIEDLNRTHNNTDSTHQTCQGIILYYTGGTAESEFEIGDLRVSNNTIRRLYSSFIQDNISGHGDVNAISLSGTRLIVENNTISEIKSLYGRDTEAIYTKGSDVIIIGNTIVNGGQFQAAINCKHSDYVRGNCIVANNTIRFTAEYSALTSYKTTGIRIENDDVTVIGNRIIGSTAIGIDSGGGDKLSQIIKNNNIRFTSGIGIVSYGSMKLNVIENNEVIGDSITSGSAILISVQTSSISSLPVDMILRINNNSLVFLDNCVGASDTRSIRIYRNAKYKEICISNNSIINNSNSPTKRWINIASNSLGENLNGGIEVLRIFNNSFLPITVTTSLMSLFLTDMNGLLEIYNNSGFITENQLTVSTSSNTLANVSHGLSSWAGIIGPSSAPPIEAFVIIPQGPMGSASYAYVQNPTVDRIDIKLNVSPGLTVPLTLKIARGRLTIP